MPHRRRDPHTPRINWRKVKSEFVREGNKLLDIDGTDADGRLLKADPDDVVALLQERIARHEGLKVDLKYELEHFDSSTIALAIDRIIEDRLWEARCNHYGEPFDWFELFVTDPCPYGLGTTTDEVLRHCRKHPEIRSRVANELAPINPVGRPSNNGDGVTNYPVTGARGNSPSYRLKCLKAKDPKLFEDHLDGLIDMKKAEEKAGIKPPVATLEKIRTVLWREKFWLLPPEQIEELKAYIDQPYEPARQDPFDADDDYRAANTPPRRDDAPLDAGWDDAALDADPTPPTPRPRPLTRRPLTPPASPTA